MSYLMQVKDKLKQISYQHPTLPAVPGNKAIRFLQSLQTPHCSSAGHGAASDSSTMVIDVGICSSAPGGELSKAYSHGILPSCGEA